MCHLISFIGVTSQLLMLWSVEAGLESLTFHKKTVSTCGPERLGNGLVERSRTSCAFSCMYRYKTQCSSFMYNRVTKLCTPGSGLSPLFPPPTSTEGDLYLGESCDSNQNFRSYSYGGETTYAAYFNSYQNFTDAETTCQSLGGNLFVAKTLARFDLFKFIVNSTGWVWIGLNDIQVEGMFVWVDDGQEVDPVVKTNIFETNQPDNWENADCAYGSIWNGRFVLDDAPCSGFMTYVCEKRSC